MAICVKLLSKYIKRIINCGLVSFVDEVELEQKIKIELSYTQAKRLLYSLDEIILEDVSEIEKIVKKAVREHEQNNTEGR